MLQHHEIANLLSSAQPRIARHVGAALWHSHFWREQVSAGRMEGLVYDATNALVVLRRAIRHRAPLIWQSHLHWLCRRLHQHGGSRGRVHELVAQLWAASATEVPPASHAALYSYIQAGLQALASQTPAVISIQTQQHALSEKLVAATFDIDWQWQEAYSTGGRAAASTDAWFAVDALKDALEADDLVVRAVESLRLTLRSRRLTSMHLRQWYWLLAQTAQHFDAALLQQWQAVLERAQQAVVYADPAYQALLRAQGAIVADVAATTLALRLAPSPTAAAEAVGWLLAHLGESLVCKDVEPLHYYVHAWNARHSTGSVDLLAMREMVAVLNGALERRLPESVARRVVALLAVLLVEEPALVAVDT